MMGRSLASLPQALTQVLLALLVSVATPLTAAAQSSRGFDDSAANLMVVLRESVGVNKQDETLVPMGKFRGRTADGKEIEVDTGWFSYLGDMHIRFVFDTPTMMPNATPQDLERLKLTPEGAVELAVKNIKRVYGEPRATPWNDLMQVQGKSPDLNSSYFLDREFWSGLLKQHPEGIVAIVAKRGGLLYAPLSNQSAVDGMRKSVAYLHASSDRMRVSSALYLFKDGKWSVFQAPVKQ
jgi:hypothetical protein